MGASHASVFDERSSTAEKVKQTNEKVMVEHQYPKVKNWYGNILKSALGTITIAIILSISLTSCGDKKFTLGDRTFEIKDIVFEDSMVVEGYTHYAGRDHMYLCVNYYETKESFTKNMNKLPSKAPSLPILIDGENRQYTLKFSFTKIESNTVVYTLVYGSVPKKSDNFKLKTKDSTVSL